MSEKTAKDFIKEKTFNAVITDMGGCDMVVEPDVVRAEDAYKAVDMAIEPVKDLVEKLKECISNVEKELL